MKLTPSEYRFHELLSDGLLHFPNEFLGLLDDPDMAQMTAVNQVMTRLRNKLKLKGLDIIHTAIVHADPKNRRKGYRLVRYIESNGQSTLTESR